jgi:hypothetical protein
VNLVDELLREGLLGGDGGVLDGLAQLAPDDREALGSCMNLTEEQTRHLNNLPPGLAVVHDERIGEAVLVRVQPVEQRVADHGAPAPRVAAPPGARSNRSYLYRHAGCHGCPSPCDFLHQVLDARQETTTEAALEELFDGLLLDGVEPAWQAWSCWRSGVPPQRPGGEPAAGVTYCAATQAVYGWLGRLLQARRSEGRLLPEDRLGRERAARAISALVANWVDRTELTDEGRAAFDQARQGLLDAVAKDPPQERPGCRSCPARCRMLPLVGPHLPIVARSIAARATGSSSADTRLVAVEAAVDGHIPILRRRPGDETVRRHILYCTLSNVDVPPEASGHRDELLDLLREGR